MLRQSRRLLPYPRAGRGRSLLRLHGQTLMAAGFLRPIVSSANPLEVGMALSTYEILPAWLQKEISTQRAALSFLQSTWFPSA